MSLEEGARLGPYVILAPLGEGGMGEVYRARDSRLGRTVAIKTIRSSALSSERARARFQREARTISALTHPNICTLHDVGQQNGVDYLVMEYLEGESLADRLAKGRMSFEDALRYGIEIAAAVDHAHRHGIIHRDLKPGNVLLTKSGAKLLDFGLARLVHGEGENDKNAPTIEKPLTEEGTMPGTLQFIAPEQLAGKEADARSDIFAFGNILYRMASGRPPFAGDSAGSLIASISRDEPAPVEPAALNDLIVSCLKKVPDERMQSAHDCKLALEWMRRPVRTTAAAPRSRAFPIAAAALCGALAVVAVWLTVRSRATTPVRHFSIDLPAPFALEPSSELAISPDGTAVVAVLDRGAGRQLFFRSFNQSSFTALDGTHNALFAFFSPDSRWIGFAADGKLKKMRMGGGTPVTICEAPRLRGATWGPDDTIVFAPVSTGGGLSRVNAGGGEVEQLTTVDVAHGERSHRWPHFLPDGKHVMFSLEDWGADYSRKRLGIVDLQTKKRTTIMQGGGDGRVIPGGLMLFGRDDTLFAVRFDAANLRVSGLPVPVLENVRTHIGLGRAYVDVADDGTVVYAEPDREMRRLTLVDRRGNETAISDQERSFQDVRISPDGTQLLVAVGEYPANDLWLVNLARNSWSRIAPEGKNIAPIWSQSGDQVFFASNRSGMYNVFSIRTDGNGSPKQVTNREYWPFPRSISADGRTLIVDVQHPVTSNDLWTVDVASGRESPLLVGPFDQDYAEFSPDGQRIAYVSNESGRNEVYVQHFPATGRKWSVSREGGTLPRWSRNGRELFFRNGQKVMVADVGTQPELVIGAPKELFEGEYAPAYDVSADGQRFVMLKSQLPPSPSQLQVILGGTSDMQRRVSTAEKRD
jgi:Tol biopolymer transport system component/tRNA A-37 threonylcarbamoyl transferase component Bud32